MKIKAKHNSILLGSIFILLLRPYLLYAIEWETIESGTTERLSDICFVDSSDGWAVGFNGTIIKTEDCGDNWKIQGSPTTNFLNKVSFINKDIGFISVYRSPISVSPVDGPLLRTADSGLNWEILNVDSLFSVSDIYFTSPDTGWIVGAWGIEYMLAGIILKSCDAGESWKTMFKLPPNDSYLEFKDIVFFNNYFGAAIAATLLDLWSHETYYTFDGGNSWIKQSELDSNYTNFPGYFIESKNDTIFSYSFSRVFMSPDYGLTWTSFCSGEWIRDLYTCSGRLVYTLSPNYLRVCKNGTFTTIYENSSVEMYGISRNKKDQLFIVGDNGSLFRGKDISMSIGDSNTNLYIFNLLQNYPNPFNSSTIIRYSCSDASHIKLTIYNIKGQKIVELIDSYHHIGEYSIQWDGKNSENLPCSSGIYFYRLTWSRNGLQNSITKKLVFSS